MFFLFIEMDIFLEFTIFQLPESVAQITSFQVFELDT
jgi:hypothetical protein